MATKTFNEIVHDWKLMKRNFVKLSTFSTYSITLEYHLLPYFGSMTSIKECDIQNFIFQKHENGLSYKSIKDILSLLKMILHFASKNGFSTVTTWDIIIPNEKQPKKIQVFNIETQKRLMNYIKRNFTFKNLGIYICLTTGLRIGEVCALQWKDLNIDSGLISISKTIGRIYNHKSNYQKRTKLIIDTPKTKTSIRDVPMPNELIKILKSLNKIVNQDYYILTNDSMPIEPRTYRNYFKKLLKTLNMPKLKFHGLRHSFATRCIECNCDYKTVSVILGHSNISTTLNLYVHPNIDQKKRCINKMFKYLKH